MVPSGPTTGPAADLPAGGRAPEVLRPRRRSKQAECSECREQMALPHSAEGTSPGLGWQRFPRIASARWIQYHACMIQGIALRTIPSTPRLYVHFWDGQPGTPRDVSALLPGSRRACLSRRMRSTAVPTTGGHFAVFSASRMTLWFGTEGGGEHNAPGGAKSRCPSSAASRQAVRRSAVHGIQGADDPCPGP